MKIIDAYWEKRNLGVETKEVIVENSDTADMINSGLSTLDNAEYVICKVPICRFDVYRLLTNHNFIFMECSINMVLDVNRVVISPLQKRINMQVSYRELVEQNEFENVFQQIKKGLFDSDRVFLDPFFSKEQAANRYVYWIEDELKIGSQLYEITYKEKPVGFFTFKQLNENTYFPFLTGLYPPQITGIGCCIVQKPAEEVLKRNGKYISTHISTNNSAIHKCLIQIGFISNDVKYIFIKHNKI
jgi:hypothetical protein